MASERLEVRLDPNRRKKLDYLANQADAPASELVRRFIDSAYESAMIEHRLELVAHIASAELEAVPDPEELSRQLDETYEIADPYRHEHSGLRGRTAARSKGTRNTRAGTGRP